MTKAELLKQLEKIDNLKDMVGEINLATNDESVLEILKCYGVELDSEELKNMLSTTDELDEELLEAVAGGCKCGWLRKVIVWGVNCILKAAKVDARMECC